MNAQTQPAEGQSEALTFESLNLTPEVMKALVEIGYESPTPVQHAAYGPAIGGRDIIVQARTGTGKTAAFGIPIVDRIVQTEGGVQALILAPTRELALQSERELKRLGQYRELSTTAVYGGAPMGKQIDDLAEGAQIVSGTPGRVLDHLRRGTFDASNLRVLVLDEMDEMLSMGFAKELNAILELIPGVDKRQTMCFSATVDGQVQRHAQKHMKDPEVVSLSSDAVGATQISHYTYMVSGSDRTGDLIKILNVEDPEGAIIFCNMKSETERVATELQNAGFNADWLNGDLPQKDRERIMASTREGKLRYLVATDVAARGIDISHLTHVVNFSFPESAATYVHRTGRTGRAGRTGCAISLVSPQELGRLYYLRLEYKISPVERDVPNSGEENTRRELDRIRLLEQAVGGRMSATQLALAQRLLTHPEAETLVAGLLKAFFGDKDEAAVDEQAADARRAREGTPVREARPPRSRRGRDDGRGRRDRDDDRGGRDRDRGREDASSRRRDGEEREARAGADAEREPAGDTTGDATEGAEGEGRRRRRRSRGRREDGEQTASSDSGEARQEGNSEAGRADGEDGAAPARERSAAADEATLYLKVGRKDGARVGEIAKLMHERGGLEREDVGRIRVRDRYTLVGLPDAKVDSALEALAEATLGDQPLAAERARVSSK